MNPLQGLVELQAIRDLKAKFFYHLDNKEWNFWRALFTSDATMQIDGAVSTLGRDGRTGPVHRGIDAIADYVTNVLANAETVHHGHTPLINLTSTEEAKGIWAMHDIVQHVDHLRHGYGHYRETYRKIGGEWKILSLELTRTRLTTYAVNGSTPP